MWRIAVGLSLLMEIDPLLMLKNQRYACILLYKLQCRLAKATKPFHHCVLKVYTKTYNKYFLTGEKKKLSPSIGSEELNKYKLAVQMVKKIPQCGFSDVALSDTTNGIKRKDNYDLIDGSMLLRICWCGFNCFQLIRSLRVAVFVANAYCLENIWIILL